MTLRNSSKNKLNFSTEFYLRYVLENKFGFVLKQIMKSGPWSLHLITIIQEHGWESEDGHRMKNLKLNVAMQRVWNQSGLQKWSLETEERWKGRREERRERGTEGEKEIHDMRSDRLWAILFNRKEKKVGCKLIYNMTIPFVRQGLPNSLVS